MVVDVRVAVPKQRPIPRDLLYRPGDVGGEPAPVHVELYVPDGHEDKPVLRAQPDPGPGYLSAEQLARLVRWPIPMVVASEAFYASLEQFAPLAAQVAAGLSVEVQDGVPVQHLTVEARAARAALAERLLEHTIRMPRVEWVDVDTAFTREQLEAVVDADTTGAGLAAAAEQLRASVRPVRQAAGTYMVVDGLEERLAEVRETARQRVRDRLAMVSSMASGDRYQRDVLVRRIAGWEESPDTDRSIGKLAGLSHTAIQKIVVRPAGEDDSLPRLHAAVAALRQAWAPDPAPAAGDEDRDEEYDELLEEQAVDDHRRHRQHVQERTCVVCGKPSRAIVKRWQVGKVLVPAEPDDPHRSDTGYVDDLSQPPSTSGQPSWTVCGTVHARHVIDTDRAHPIGGIRVAGNDELLYQLDSYRYLPDDTELPEVIVRLRGAMLLTDHSLTELARTVYTRRPAAAALHLNRLRADIARTAELLASIHTYTPPPRTFRAADTEPHPDDVSQVRHGQDVYSTFAGLNLYDSPTHWEKNGSPTDRYHWEQLTALGELTEIPQERIIIPRDHQDPEDEV